MNGKANKPHKFTFGKFKGDLVSDHINAEDKSYLLWADQNVSFFNLTDEEKAQLDKVKDPAPTYAKVPNYHAAKYAALDFLSDFGDTDELEMLEHNGWLFGD